MNDAPSSLQPPASSLPRLVIAGLSGDAGKTLVSVGLILAAKKLGLPVRGFKKGPDYIDASWLSWATGHPARNLDGYMMGAGRAVASFARHAVSGGLNLIEGNRGLHDGCDAQGTHSTAELAKALRAPVVLAVNCAKVTRTIAACILGCQKLDPDVRIGGVVLNRVSGQRHEQVLRESIESICGIPVLGVLPRASDQTLLPGRHLGLVTPEEHHGAAQLKENLAKLLEGRVDIERLLGLARQAPPLNAPAPTEFAQPEGCATGLKIGYLKDSAFTFYYPENLEALEHAGAELVPLSALAATALPDGLDALYIGGGFPETHGANISANRAFLESLRRRIEDGLPVYAECGGLMLLSRSILWQGRNWPMAGVLPFRVEMCGTPQGHGYTQLCVDRANLFFPQGLVLKGHEFHYSRIVPEGDPPPMACAVNRGTGCFAGRDGIVMGNVWASYTHLHAVATPEWADGLLTAARNFAQEKIVRAHV